MPKILAQGISGQNRANVHFNVIGVGQGQPARGRRFAFRILQAELGPQRPVGLGARQQGAKQRVPLLRLGFRDAYGRLAIHRFLEHIHHALQQIGNAAKAGFELKPHINQFFGHHTMLEAVLRAHITAQVFRTGEVGHLTHGLLHELLVRLQLARLKRHLFKYSPQFARQRVLGQQLAQIFVELLQPVGRRVQARVMGKM